MAIAEGGAGATAPDESLGGAVQGGRGQAGLRLADPALHEGWDLTSTAARDVRIARAVSSHFALNPPRTAKALFPAMTRGREWRGGAGVRGNVSEFPLYQSIHDLEGARGMLWSHDSQHRHRQLRAEHCSTSVERRMRAKAAWME